MATKSTTKVAVKEVSTSKKLAKKAIKLAKDGSAVDAEKFYDRYISDIEENIRTIKFNIRMENTANEENIKRITRSFNEEISDAENELKESSLRLDFNKIKTNVSRSNYSKEFCQNIISKKEAIDKLKSEMLQTLTAEAVRHNSALVGYEGQLETYEEILKSFK